MHLTHSIITLLGCFIVLSTAQDCSQETSLPGTPPPVFRLTIQKKGSRSQAINIELRFLRRTRSSCLYDVLDSGALPNKDIPLVAKTPIVPRTSIPDNEIQALSAIGDFRFVGGTEGGTSRHWIIMKKHDGDPLRETADFKERFPKGYNTDDTPEGIRKCRLYMQERYDHILYRWINYVDMTAHQKWWGFSTQGWSQNNFDDANFLWSRDMTELNIIDWSQAKVLSTRTADHDGAWRNDMLDALAKRSSIPLEDNLQGEYHSQGICSSEQRNRINRERQEPQAQEQ